jgi:hypothetical protein
MKTTQTLLLSVFSATALFALTGSAQTSYSVVGDNGIAASPKLRQMLNDRKASGSGGSDLMASYHAVGSDGIAASPKVRQSLTDRGASGSSSDASQAAYAAVGSDGIAASPKLRQMLNEQGGRFQIAPVR